MFSPGLAKLALVEALKLLRLLSFKVNFHSVLFVVPTAFKLLPTYKSSTNLPSLAGDVNKTLFESKLNAGREAPSFLYIEISPIKP